MFGKIAPTLPYISAGLNVGGGIADAFERKSETKAVETQKQLALRSSRRDESQMVGRQIAATGAAGVEMSGTTLDKINQTHYEFALDQAIIRASASLEKASLLREGRQGIIGGFARGLSALAPTLMTGGK